ncbi:MAG: hypothetical protein CMI01_00360 [Oceanospirillaceae bacterium]|nr:hypothetical protein [Oceanospirillaceae bacterium]
MSLSIDPALAEGNPYNLTPDELDQVRAWNNMTADERGEYLHYAKQRSNIEHIVASAEFEDSINSNVVQRLAGGGAQVGGALRPDALLTINGVEMTLQQAVDIGIRSSSSIGTQTADLD